MTFYTWRDDHPLPWNDLIARRRPVALAIVANHADQPIALRASTLFQASSDPAGREQAAAAWRAAVERARTNAAVLRNASAFFAASDVRLAIDLLERARAIDPDAKVAAPAYTAGARYWSDTARQSLRDRHHRTHLHGRYPGVERDRRDAVGVGARAAEDVDRRAHAGGGRVDADAPLEHQRADPVRALALDCFDRASQLDPSLVEARAQAVSFRRHEREWAVRQRLFAAQTAIIGAERLKALKLNDPERYRLLRESEAQALSTLEERDRFVLLAALTRYTDQVGTDSRRYAEEALALAAKYKNDPGYAVVVFDANMTLSRVALAGRRQSQGGRPSAGRVEGAGIRRHRLQLRSRGPIERSSRFLDSGEHAAVIEYLERMAQVNVVSKERLLKSAEAIKAGRMPDWYQAQLSKNELRGGPEPA